MAHSRASCFECPKVLKLLRWKARTLERSNAIPGWMSSDYEQSLAEALIRKAARYRPERAGFTTFAARVIESAALDLRRRGKTAGYAEYPMSSIEDLETAEHVATTERLWAPSPTEPELAIDLRRFIQDLSPAQTRCLLVLLDGNIAGAASDAGFHRSTLYEARGRLQRQARAAGLGEYLHTPTDPASRS